MLYVIHGTDTGKAREKTHVLMDALQKKKPDAELFTLDTENYTPASFEELIGGQGLFERKYIVFLNTLFENKEAKELVLDKVKAVAESDNVFLLLEGKVDAKTVKKLEKHAAKIQSYDATEKKKQSFNTFSLTDALASRDKKKLWVLLNKAFAHDVSAEEVHGLLSWQMRTLLLTAKTKSAAESGLKPFVYNKAKSALKHFEEKELATLSSKLVALYHAARAGKMPLDISLEQFVLEL